MKDSIFVLGGWDSNLKFLPDMLKYDIQTDLSLSQDLTFRYWVGQKSLAFYKLMQLRTRSGLLLTRQVLGDQEFTANKYCKSRNLPNMDM